MSTANAALSRRSASRFCLSLSLVLTALGLLNPSAALAADGVWSGTTSGGLWSNPANWSGGVVADGTGAIADFSTLDLTANNTVLFDAPHTLGSLVFGDTTSTYFNWILSNNGNAANVLTLDGTAPSITINSGICTNNLVLAGTAGVTVNGGPAVASSLVLGAANTFTGNLTLNAGAVGNLGVYVNNAAALGGSAGAPNSVVLAGNAATRAILYLSVADAAYPAYTTLVMRPTGDSISSRAEFRSVNGSATWNGNIILDGVSGSALARSDFYADATTGTMTINGAVTSLNNFMGAFDLRGAGAGVINGTINAPNAQVIKDDNGTWTINGQNNNWASTLVGRGTLKLGANNVLPLTAGITIGSTSGGSALLDLNGFNQIVTSLVLTGSNTRKITNSATAAVLTVSNVTDVSYAGAIVSGLSLNKVGPATLTLSGASTYTGNTIVSNGVLAVTGSISGTPNIIIGPGATLSPTGLNLGASQKLSPVNGSAIIGGNVNINSGTLVLNYTVGTPALTISGGNLVLGVGSTVIINVTGSLTAGASYPLVSVSNNGQVSGAVPPSVVLNGASGLAGSLSITDGMLYLTIDTKPLIASQTPVTYTNVATLFEGASPAFSVTAGGLPPLSYQWYTNGVLNTAATSSTMVWTNVKLGSISTYCVVLNANGSAVSTVWSATVVPAPTAPYPMTVMSNNLAGYWRLDEPDDGSGYNNGVLAHDYWGGNNGLYNSTTLGGKGYSANTDPTTTAAIFGLNGAQDNAARGIAGIDFAGPTNSSKTFSIEAWVAGWSMLSEAGIVTKGYGGGGEQFSLDTGTTNRAFRFFVRDASGVAHVASSTIVPQDYKVWYHLVGVCDEPNGLVTLYINGKVAATATIGTNAGILTSSSLMNIGARYSSSTALANNVLDLQFLGYVNDVAAYNTALSSNQVQAHYFAAGIAPTITSQPLASTNLNQNGTLTLSATANGTLPLTYSWFDVNAGSYLPDQTNATLVVKNLQAANSYYLTVANAFGSTNSSTVTVSVTSGFTVSMVPAAGSLTVYSGMGLNCVVTVAGTEPFYFRWFTNGVAVTGATNANYVLTVPLGSSTVSCLVSNSYNGLSSQTLGPVNLTGIAAPTNTYQLAVLSNMPAAYWTLSEPANGLNNGNAGVIARDYAGGHNGSYANVELGLPGFDAADAPWLTAVQYGTFATTNGVMSEGDNTGNGVANLDFAKPTGSDVQFSVEAWVNPTLNSNSIIVAKGCGHSEQFSLDIYLTGFRFVMRDAAGVSHSTARSAAPALGQWYHVVGVWDGSIGTARMFVNGTNVSTLSGLTNGLGLWTPAENALLPSASRVHIGAQASDIYTNIYDMQFQGKIAQVALYNYALSTNQVQAHYYTATNTTVVTPGVMAVSQLSNGQMQLSWSFGGTLQSATNVAGPYRDETGVVSPYTITTTNAQMFYRIKQQ